jgi:hypothetical protein
LAGQSLDLGDLHERERRWAAGPGPVGQPVATLGGIPTPPWIYLASKGGYEDSTLPTGMFAGSPQDALDCACDLHRHTPIPESPHAHNLPSPQPPKDFRC